MAPEKVSRLKGDFLGWSPGTIYQLVDGSKWRLARARASKSNRYRPAARVWKYDGKRYLEIVDTGDFAEVVQILS